MDTPGLEHASDDEPVDRVNEPRVHGTRAHGTRVHGTRVHKGRVLGRLLDPSKLAPVDLDLRWVLLVGIALWLVALVVAVILTSTGRADLRPVWICGSGVMLGLVGLAWERRQGPRRTA